MSEDASISSLPSGSRLIFAVLGEERAGAFADRVMQLASGSNPVTVQVHPAGGIDDLVLPEFATEAQQGWVIGFVAGGLAGLVAGGLAGLLDWVTGLGVGLGSALGLMSGILIGGLCASMSGHRRVSKPLRQAVDGLSSHERLVTVDLTGSSKQQEIWAELEAQSPRLLDTL